MPESENTTEDRRQTEKAGLVRTVILSIGGLLLLFVLVIFLLVTDDVRDLAYARGLITVIISFGTIAVAMALTLSVLLSRDHDLKETQERFSSGKEVLALLLGILGTIVGFYFGHDAPPPARRLSVSEIKFSPSEPLRGQPATITVLTPGGELPLDFDFRIDGVIVSDMQVRGHDARVLTKDVLFDVAGPLNVDVFVADSTGDAAHATQSVIVVEPQ